MAAGIVLSGELGVVRSGIRKYFTPQDVFTLLSGQAASVQGEVSQADGAPKGFAVAVQGTVNVSLLSDPPVESHLFRFG